jgi:hypothetical protein
MLLLLAIPVGLLVARALIADFFEDLFSPFNFLESFFGWDWINGGPA